MVEYEILSKLNAIERKLDGKLGKGWITLREAVEYTGLSDSTLRRLVYDGKLTCSRKSGKLLFKTSWIDKFLIYGKQRLSAKERRQLQELSL